MLFLKNLASVLISACVAVTLSTILNNTQLYAPDWWVGIVFFSCLCLVMNTVYALNARSRTFTELLMAGIVARLLLSLVVILLFAMFRSVGFYKFSIHFIMQYILFTIFEIGYLLYIIKNHQTNPTKNEK